MRPVDYANLLVVVAFTFTAGAFAQGAVPLPSPGPRPPSPSIQGGPTIPPHLDQAQSAYAECVRRKQGEMVLYGQATQVRDLVDHRERNAELLRTDPQMAKRYPGGVDEAIGEAFRSYRAAGGSASRSNGATSSGRSGSG